MRHIFGLWRACAKRNSGWKWVLDMVRIHRCGTSGASGLHVGLFQGNGVRIKRWNPSCPNFEFSCQSFPCLRNFSSEGFMHGQSCSWLPALKIPVVKSPFWIPDGVNRNLIDSNCWANFLVSSVWKLPHHRVCSWLPGPCLCANSQV